MSLDLIPQSLRQRYRFEQREHACSILAGDFPGEWKDLLDCLKAFVLKRSYITKGGGGRSDIPITLDGFLKKRGWSEKRFDIQVMVDGQPYPTPTHEIDNFKNRVGVEVEWNNKTEFYDRDLNNFRLLHQLHVLSVGVIITRVSELQELFDKLSIGKKYGPSTTHWKKLIPKVNGGGAGGCPLLLVGTGFCTLRSKRAACWSYTRQPSYTTYSLPEKWVALLNKHNLWLVLALHRQVLFRMHKVQAIPCSLLVVRFDKPYFL